MVRDKAQVTRLLQEMEKQGLIEKRPHPTDRRSICLALTPLACERVNQRTGGRTARTNGCVPLLTPAEIAQLQQLLDKIEKGLESTDWGQRQGIRCLICGQPARPVLAARLSHSRRWYHWPHSPSRRGAIVITLIKESDQLKMPWKNRQGTTAPILISPGSTLDKLGFDYRLSSAPSKRGVSPAFPATSASCCPSAVPVSCSTAAPRHLRGGPLQQG